MRSAVRMAAVAGCAITLASGLASADGATVLTRSVGSVELVCGNPGGWKPALSVGESADHAELVRIVLTSAGREPPPEFHLRFRHSSASICGLWRPEAGWSGYRPYVNSKNLTHLTEWEPLYAAVGPDDVNRLTVAAEEVVQPLITQVKLREETGLVEWDLAYFVNRDDPGRRLQGVEPTNRYETCVRLDASRRAFSDTVRSASDWIFATRGIAPMKAPPDAYAAWYSTWYAFHRDIKSGTLESEYDRAAALGMKGVLIDSGWFSESSFRGFRDIGDWSPSAGKFPDVAAHIAMARAKGLRVVMWFGIPFAGFDTRAHRRFKGKFLDDDNDMGSAVLDPRFPEVRAYLVDALVRAVGEWKVDGVKLDFLNTFFAWKKDPAEKDGFAGRDFRSVGEATLALLDESVRRMRSIRPDLLVEIRPSYQGPEMQRFGNMMRVADCPASAAANRCGIASLKLAVPFAAIHSDMLMWDRRATPEEAARHILDCAFAAVQYSVRLDDSQTTPEVREMMRHWIGFFAAHEETLQRGRFTPHRPFSNYPVLESETAAERIVAVYEQDQAVDIVLDRTTYVLNASGTGRVTLRLSAVPSKGEVFDTFGRPAAAPKIPAGLVDIAVPQSGYVVLHP